VQRYRTDLETYDVDVPDGSDTTGWLGLLMFIHGIVDLLLDINLCATLHACGREYLLLSAVATLVLSTATCLYLSFKTLIKIESTSSEARDWHLRNNAGVTCVLLASCCRIESMSILRLKLRGRMIVEFPIEKKHFHFLRYYSGWVHTVLAQIPQLLVCMAFQQKRADGELCEELGVFSVSRSVVFSVVMSSVSIIWSAVSHLGSLTVARATRVSEQDRLAADMQASLHFPALVNRGGGVRAGRAGLWDPMATL
jgi:hypothetical protein